MKLLLVLTSLFLLTTASSAPQLKAGIDAEGGTPDDRGSSRVLYWNNKTNSSAGWFAFNYGRPLWKKVYEEPAKFDAMTKGKVWRMGNNYWTALDTCLPLEGSGRDVGIGLYFLGLRRSADGSKWSLAFIDPAKVRSGRIDAFEMQKAPIRFEAPMVVEKPQDKVEKLTLTLTYPKDDPKHVTLRVAWGNLALSAPIEATVPE